MIFLLEAPKTVGDWCALVSLIAMIISVISTVVVLVKKLVVKSIELLKNKNFKDLYNAAKQAIIEAEATGASGADKKAMVLNAVQKYAEEVGIEFTDELKEQISEAIDNSIEIFNLLAEAAKKGKANKKKIGKGE